MTCQVIVLNGGSSSGKSTLAKALQVELAGYWLRLGVDTLIAAAPARLLAVGGGLDLGSDGSVIPGPAFTAVEDQWMRGVAGVAKAGGRVIVEDNFVSGPHAQHRWREALTGVPTAWVAVRCPPVVAAQRERDRGDRVEGMAAHQAEAVHRGIDYDVEVDTSVADAASVAVSIREHLGLPEHRPGALQEEQ